MIKRFLSALLILSVLTQPMVKVFGKTSLTDDLDFKYKLLRELKIMPEEEHKDYGIIRDTSKKAFLAYVCNIYGGYGYSEATADDAVLCAENLGLIHKGQSDLEKLLNFEEALTIIVRLLGYENFALQNGGYPMGYVTVAHSLGILNNISCSMSDNLKEYEIVELLYNAIEAPYAQIDYISESKVVYENTSNKTVLHELRGIYKLKGIIEATESICLRDDEAADSGKIRIDGYLYKCEKDYAEYLGMNVFAYICEEHSSEEDAVFAIIPTGNSEKVLQAEDILGVSDNFSYIEYYDQNGKIKRISIDKTATVIFNGQPLSVYTKEAFCPKDGNIRFLCNSGGAYDVVFITSYETIVANKISKLNKSVENVYTFDNDNICLSLEKDSDKDIIDIFYKDEKVGIGDINEGDTLKYAKSFVDGRSVIKGYLSKESVLGTVSAIGNDGDYKTVTTENGVYKLSAAYSEAVLKGDTKALNIKVGETYRFYIDVDGYISYAEPESSKKSMQWCMRLVLRGQLRQR